MNEAKQHSGADTYAIAADTLGADLVAALVGEFKTLPDHWARLNAENQQKAIERIKEKIRHAVEQVLYHVSRGEFAAVQADLDSVTCKNGITASIKIPRDALYRHQLYDATGQKVLLVLSNPGQWLQRMDEIKARADQEDLFNRNYDPARDQPGYRRDQDRLTPARSWEDLKSSFTAPPDGETKPPETDSPESAPPAEDNPEVKAGDDQAIDPERVALIQLLNKLEAIGYSVSLGWLQTLSKQQIMVTINWADEYVSTAPAERKIPRPLWLLDGIDDQKAAEG